MDHVEFNRRFAAVQRAQTTGEGLSPQELIDEAVVLHDELPPAADRAAYLREVIAGLKAQGATPSVMTATSAEARKAAWADPKMRPEHKASRGRTRKLTPQEHAQQKLHAAYAAYTAHHEALKAARATLARAEADFKTSYARVVAVGAELLALKGAAKAAPSPQKAPAAKPVTKATPKAAAPAKPLSDAMLAVLRVIANVPEATANELSPAQYSCARMHLIMRGLVAKDAKGNDKVTTKGQAALKGV